MLRYNVATNQQLPSWSLGGNLLGIDLSPDGKTLAIADSSETGTNNWIHQVDVTTGVDTKKLFPLSFSEGGTYSVAYGSDGQILITSLFNGSGFTPLRRYDPAIDTTSIILGNPSSPGMVSASADRNTIGYIEGDISSGPLHQYDVRSGTLSPETRTDWFTFEVGVSRDGSQFAVPTYDGMFLYNSRLQKLATIGDYANDGPISVAYSPNSDVMYVAWYSFGFSNEVRAYSTTDFRLLATWNVNGQFNWVGNGAYDEGRIKTSADGSLVFVTVDNGVSIIPVPEPTTGGLAIAGLLAVAGTRRKGRGRGQRPAHG